MRSSPSPPVSSSGAAPPSSDVVAGVAGRACRGRSRRRRGRCRRRRSGGRRPSRRRAGRRRRRPAARRRRSRRRGGPAPAEPKTVSRALEAVQLAAGGGGDREAVGAGQAVAGLARAGGAAARWPAPTRRPETDGSDQLAGQVGGQARRRRARAKRRPAGAGHWAAAGAAPSHRAAAPAEQGGTDGEGTCAAHRPAVTALERSGAGAVLGAPIRARERAEAVHAPVAGSRNTAAGVAPTASIGVRPCTWFALVRLAGAALAAAPDPAPPAPRSAPSTRSPRARRCRGSRWPTGCRRPPSPRPTASRPRRA